MSLSYAEGWATTPEEPFVDGQNLKHFDRDTAWLISADQDGYTFTCTDPKDYQHFGYRRHEIRRLLELCPAASEIYGYGESPEGFRTFSVPTLGRANAFAAEKFAGLPVAGIQAYQEQDMGNTYVTTYLHHLSDGPEFRLPVARGHERHFHDLIGHFLGAATVDVQSFEVFRALSKDAVSLWAKGPQWPASLYVGAVASGFDRFSDAQVDRTMKQYGTRDGYLLGQTLSAVRVRWPDFYPRAVGIVQSFGINDVATWEAQTLPAYYEQIADRLR